jgi:GNAT superfamily N-acetyltransferase
LAEQLRIAVEAKGESVDQAVHVGLRAFNRALVGWPERQNFNVVLRVEEDRLRGGILASLNFDTLVLEDVLVEQGSRHGDHGARLIALAEEEGHRRSAQLAVVSTFTWQARPFYEKLGYAVFAELPYNNGIFTLYSLKKFPCA